MQTNFPLVFTADQIAIIDKALQQAPYFVAAPVLAEINRQLEALQKAPNIDIPWKSSPPASGAS